VIFIKGLRIIDLKAFAFAGAGYSQHPLLVPVPLRFQSVDTGYSRIDEAYFIFNMAC
jgi:hypothetical protein